MLRVTSRQRLVSWDEFDATDRSSSPSSLSPSQDEEVLEAATPSLADANISSLENKKENESHQDKRLLGKKRDRRSSFTSASSSTLSAKQPPKGVSDTNNKKAMKKCFSFSELTKLSSSRIAPQPMPNASDMAPHSAIKTTKMTNEVPVTEPSVMAKKDNALMPAVVIPPDHPSPRNEVNHPSMYPCTHAMNDTDDDDEYGFTFPLDEEEHVDDFDQPYETVVAGVVESHRSHYERAVSCSPVTGEGSPPAPISFKTTANPCYEEKPRFEKSLLTWENSTVNMLTLLESTRNNNGADIGGAIRSIPPPHPSPPDIGFTDLMDDAILHALSYLTSADIRNVSVTSRGVRSLTTAPGAAKHLWLDICQRESWGSSISVLSKYFSGEENRRISFRDNLSIPVSVVSQSAAVGNENINLSVLLGLTANSYPTAIDPAFFRNNIGRGTRRSLHRRPPEFRTFPLTCDLKNRRLHDYEEIGMIGTDTLNVVQFISRVGEGDRCIKSDHPFPRLSKNKPDKSGSTRHRWSIKKGHGQSSSSTASENSSHGRRFPSLRVSSSPTSFVLDFLCRGTSVVMPPEPPYFGPPQPSNLGSSSTFRNNSAITNLPADAKAISPATSSLRPFVVPKVISEVGDTVEIDVTPCLVAYFEVTILPRNESQEPPLPSTPPPSNNFSSRAAAADAAARAHIAFARSRGPNQRTAAARAFADAIAALEEDRHDRNGNDDAVEGIPPPPASHIDCVAVGLSTTSFTTQRKMPGWDSHSYGYHGDDGGIFHSSGDMIRKFGPAFGMNDTVGCGIDYKTRSIFFTCNGEFLGFAFADLDESILQAGLYPTIGVDTNCPLFINFGEKPFEYDLSPFRKWSGGLLEERLSGLLRPCDVKVGSRDGASLKHNSC